MSENIPLHIGSDPTLPLSTPVINQIIEAISPTVSVETISGGHEVTITDKNGDHTFDVMDGGGAGGMDYDNLDNKPQIEGVTLTGDVSLSELGAASTEDIPDISGLYTKPDDGIPSTDMTSAVQTSLGKADSAYQVPSGGIPSTDMTTAVQTSLGKADSAYQKPGSGIPGTDLASGVLTSIIDDTAGDGDTNKVWSADKSADLMSAITKLTPDATSSDIGKALIVKTVADGKATSYEYGEAGGGGAVIDDTAGAGDTDKAWSADKIVTEINSKFDSLPTEETGQDLLEKELYNTGLTDTVLMVLGMLFDNMPQDETATDILHSLDLECVRLNAIYELWLAEKESA